MHISALQTKSEPEASPSPASQPSPPPQVQMRDKQGPVVVGGIEFAGSAQEARERMRKKKDQRTSQMNMRDKYQLFQQL